jgi:hypothetical protein
MALPAKEDWLALMLRWRLQAQYVVPATACRHATCSLDAVPSQTKEGYYIDVLCQRLPAAADLRNLVVPMPVECVPVA